MLALCPPILGYSGSAGAAAPEEAARPATPARPAAPDAVTLTTSLITPFFGAYYVESKLRATKSFDLLFDVSYLTLENGDFETQTFTVGAGPSYHFGGNAARRWFVDVNLELMFSPWRHMPSGEVSPVEVGYSGALLVGYRIACELGPVLEIGAGVVALHFPSTRVTTDTGDVTSDAFTRIYPAPKLAVGWAF